MKRLALARAGTGSGAARPAPPGSWRGPRGAPRPRDQHAPPAASPPLPPPFATTPIRPARSET